ncbi:hypothetical protein U1701_00060 [Sphingomonas sp. PB2P19]
MKQSYSMKLESWIDPWAPGWIVFEGKVWTMAAWKEATGISGRMIGFRLHRLNWQLEEALTLDSNTKRTVVPRNILT